MTKIPLSQVLADLGVRDGMVASPADIGPIANRVREKLESFVRNEVARCLRRSAEPELDFHDPVVAIEGGTVLRVSATGGPPPVRRG